MASKTQLEEATWTAEDCMIELWHGKEVPVKKGDTVFYYDTKVQILFVRVEPAHEDSGLR